MGENSRFTTVNHWESHANGLNLEFSPTFNGRYRYLLEKWVMAELKTTKIYLIHVHTFERYQFIKRIYHPYAAVDVLSSPADLMQ